MSRRRYVLEVAWERDDMPSLVGPFDSSDEAAQWANLNIPNGIPLLRELAYPYMAPQVPKDIGRQIAAARAGLRMTQDELAAQLGRGGSVRAIQSWEAGVNVPRPRMLERLREVLGMEES